MAQGAAAKWDALTELLDSTSEKSDRSVVVGTTKIDGNSALDFVVQKQDSPVDLAKSYDDAERRIKEIRERVVVDTPDAFINAAAAALNVAADGVWDEKLGAVMHGAVAWRVKLLGWRGPYANDELGWHDRAKRHFAYWAGQQNTSPIPTTMPGADESANLSRNEASAAQQRIMGCIPITT